jgi:hypothetical protein
MYTHTHIQARVRNLVDVGVNVGVCLPVWRSLDATLVLPRACTLHPQYVPVSPSLTHSLSRSRSRSLFYFLFLQEQIKDIIISLSLSLSQPPPPRRLFFFPVLKTCACRLVLKNTNNLKKI